MKHFTLAAAALLAASTLPMQAQNPFEQQTKAVYIWNVEHQKFLSDYQSPTPNTYCLQDYGESRREAIMFELTTLNAVTGESVLFSPWTDKYMYVPAAGGFIGAKDIDQRTVLTVKDTEDGHHLLYSGETLVSPYKNGAFMLLVGYTAAHQAAGWGKVEECKWDFVEPEDLDAFLTAHGIDPESDPYVTPVDPIDPEEPDGPDEPDPDKATFEDLQYAIAEAQQALLAAKGGYVAKGDGLITDAAQFHSYYSDADEGTDFEALIDLDTYTFWHSDWHGAAPEGSHSFDVALPADLQTTTFVAEYCGRLSGNNCSPIEMSLYGGMYAPEGVPVDGDDEADAYPYAMNDAPFTTLYQTDGLGAFAGWGHTGNEDVLRGSFAFETDDFYNALRFEASTVVSDAGYGAEACFNYSEFQLFVAERVAPTIKADADAIDILEMLLEEAYSLTKTEDPTGTLTDLQAATARVLGSEEAGIHGVTLLPADTRIYDLQGRAYPNLQTNGAFGSRVQSGLRIQGGKLILK